MGNVPAKEDRGGRRRGSSFTGSIGTGGLIGGSLRGPTIKVKRSSRSEREKLKEAHARGLLVKYDENVDGGYLAPYGTYNLNLDYQISVVKEAIIERKLAPFYTPLQDFDASWTDEELLAVLSNLKLHALPHEAEDEDEDLEYDEASVDESLLSKKELRRHLSKKFNKQLKLKKLEWQAAEEKRYLEERATSRQAASDDLKLELYRTSVECPICFLYYPRWLNYSRCCNHAICTECFVQIKRLEPHLPHDHDDEGDNNGEDQKAKAEQDPNLLISEYACCPYCATPNFGVIYSPPAYIRTGLGGIPPALFKSPLKSSGNGNITTDAITDEEDLNAFEVQENYFRKASMASAMSIATQRRGSLPATHPQVITTDFIRPDWEQNLNNARAKLAKRAAAASAIHASNMLIQSNENEIEQKMIQEAMRLSLLEEESRKRRASVK